MKYLPNGYEAKKLIAEFIAKRLEEAKKLIETTKVKTTA